MNGSAQVLAALLLMSVPGVVQAREPGLNEDVRFTLKQRSSLLLGPLAADPLWRDRISRLTPAPAPDRDDALSITARRQNRRLAQANASLASPPLQPRSRLVLLAVQYRLALGDHLAVTAGIEGMKLSNRGANVTSLTSNDRIRARDWFMPAVRIEIAAAPQAAFSIGYRETLRGYGGTGRSGPLGLRDEEYLAMVRALRPERQRRLRIGGSWLLSGKTTLTMAAFDGRIDNRLSFIEGTYLPRNERSGRTQGLEVTVSHQPSPHWNLAMRYTESRMNMTGGGPARERAGSADASWSDGPWRGTLHATRSSKPALLALVHSEPRVRVEGEIRYQLPSSGRMPSAISLRLTDPDRLASSAMLRDMVPGPVDAADKARSLMMGVTLGL